METKTQIEVNGSRWAGEEPDSIESLLEVLANYPLDASFEDYGNFYKPLEASFCDLHGYPPNTISFFGNFLTISHGFSIRTNDMAVIRPLAEAIELNKSQPGYKEQAPYTPAY